jgi:hypothetical protein
MVTTAYALYDMLAPLRARMSNTPEEEVVFSTGDPLVPQSHECCGQFRQNIPPPPSLSPTQRVPRIREQWFSHFVVPQSHEIMTVNSLTTQNVTFHDYSPGATYQVESSYDEVHAETIENDLDLNNFFSRPVLAASLKWQVGNGPGILLSNFNPWSIYFRNSRVSNRISNFKLLRAKLHVRVLLNGSPLHYGRAIIYYTPLPGFDDVGRAQGINPQPIQNLVNNSQKPHLWLNPTTSQGGDLELPFLWHNNALDLPLGEFDQMGNMDIVGVTPLRHANAGTTDVNISILVWASDVVLSGPTTCNVDGISPQSDEYSNKVFSVKASNVASVMDRLSSAPVIGPYARATSLAASAMSGLAALFGFSKPLELERCLIVPKTVNDMATTGGKDDSHKLTLDPKQELTIDPRAFGLGSKDEMDILHVAQTESYLTSFTWTSGNSSPAGTILWNSIVDPAQYVIYAASGSNIPKLNMTASAFAALPFQYWRGSIIYRFQVVCSALHKGRLRIVYDPEIEVSANDPSRVSPEFNLGYQTVVDISETQDFEVVVGWGQPSSYRENNLYTGIGPTFAITPLFYNSSTNTSGNGVLGVYVMNELANPSASTDDCYVVVSMRAGPDFEVACPTGRPISRLRFRTIDDVNAPQALMAPIEELVDAPVDEVVPQASELPVSAVPSGEANMAQGAQSAGVLADLGSLTSHTNEVFMGETVRSFRTLLKRFTMSEIVYLTLPNAIPETTGVSLQRSSFPIEPGFTSFSDLSTNRVTRTVQGKEYAYGFMTPLRFISSGYVGWRGAVRWKVSTSASCCNSTRGPVSVTRYSGCNPANITEIVPDKATNAGLRSWYVGFDESCALPEGGQIIMTGVEPIASFEAPFYTSRRFLHARSLTRFAPDENTQFKPCWKYSYEVMGEFNNGSVSHQLYCAAGEDFTLGMFVGAPVVYMESIPPT